jgi:hypothetical protein
MIMKKRIILFSIGIFAFLSSVTFAQNSLQVLDLAGNDVSTSVVNVWGDSAFATTIAAPFDVKNISGLPVTVRAKKIVGSVPAGSSNTFCFAGQCYISNVSTLTAIIQPGEKDTTFVGDYKPKGNLGQALIMYVFYSTDDPNDSNYVIVQFNATALGLEQYQSEIFEVSEPFPNPASSQTSFLYEFPDNSTASFTLSDITGNIIKEIPIYNTHGILEVPVTDLSEGMYFYTFYVDGKMLMTKKLIIQK